ncbi:T9SS type A sorting domain-containing protein [Membranicola marinus]|uniref:T9SS type A sorting domain-containing protein n=1 Tax=Membranihabitans marinus TaxID=1227546 RepID=A0A953L8N0_9BACT|nr:T9SS type A sorting domain-containing protein [Membranihabitans marinus]MBY5957885.1 T9SS type A sorting domain-containing protein [Membranihabitans marinus]
MKLYSLLLFFIPILAFSQDPDVQGEPIYSQSDGTGTPFKRNETVCFVLKMGAVGNDLNYPPMPNAPFEINVSTQNLINRTVEFINSSDVYLDENFFTVTVPEDPNVQIHFVQNSTIPFANYSWFNVCGTVPETATDGSIVRYQANGVPGAYSSTNAGNDDPSNEGTVEGILPIELLSFTAFAHKDEVDLDWETATELNNSHFEVQRSPDGRNYTTIGEVRGAGTSSQVLDYAFTDEQPTPGKNYYRLKQVDYNGSFDYSPVRMVTLGADSRLSVFPNPVAPGSEITIQGQKIRTVKIYNMLGQIVVDKVYDHPQSSITISSGNLAQGIYTTRVNGVDEKRVVVK